MIPVMVGGWDGLWHWVHIIFFDLSCSINNITKRTNSISHQPIVQQYWLMVSTPLKHISQLG
jgi:hypothetical protein